MAISTYSVIMAVLCSDIFIILLYILRLKRQKVSNTFDIDLFLEN